jgi:hypothetical protein
MHSFASRGEFARELRMERQYIVLGVKASGDPGLIGNDKDKQPGIV